MNVFREGFADAPLTTRVTTHSIVDPIVSANIHNTLVRLHESKRKIFIQIWNVFAFVIFIVIIGLMMYISRMWKMHKESESDKTTAVYLADEYMPKMPPPFQEFDIYHEPSRTNRGREAEQPWIRTRDWST